MNKILFVNCCVRPQSRTLVLAKCLLQNLNEPHDEIDVTDGGVKPVDCFALERRNAKVAQGDYSDAMFDLAKQFASAQTIVVAAPFWDLSFPSFLKIYFENILVSGLTFTYQSGKPQGLCNAKRLYYVTTAGGAAFPDFGFAYVQSVFKNFFGVDEAVCFKAEGLDIVGNDAELILDRAKKQICEFFQRNRA